MPAAIVITGTFMTVRHLVQAARKLANFILQFNTEEMLYEKTSFVSDTSMRFNKVIFNCQRWWNVAGFSAHLAPNSPLACEGVPCRVHIETTTLDGAEDVLHRGGYGAVRCAFGAGPPPRVEQGRPPKRPFRRTASRWAVMPFRPFCQCP